MKYILMVFFAGLAVADWQYSEELDPITDEATRLIWTQATSDVSYYSRQPSLYFRVTGNVPYEMSIDMWVGWTTSVGEQNLPLCITRIDGEDPVEYTVSPSTAIPNKSTFFLGNESWFLFTKLLLSNQFAVRITPTGSNTMTAIFSLDGMTAAARNAGMPVDEAIEMFGHLI